MTLHALDDLYKSLDHNLWCANSIEQLQGAWENNTGFLQRLEAESGDRLENEGNSVAF